MSKPALTIIYALDDDEIFGKLISSLLKKYGFHCEVFQSSDALLKRMKERYPTLCILDLNVEGNDSSIELLKTIRSTFSEPLPIIMASSNNEHAAIAHAIEAGADDYLLKPLEKTVLVAKLTRYLQSYQLDNANFSPASPTDMEVKAVVELDVKLLEVDELGLKVQTKHLIAKGTVLPLSGDIFAKIGGRAKPILLTVVSTWVAADGKFGAYLEFDSTDDELLRGIRSWLIHQEQNAAS
jgi:DNA-binding response OmpR family regulator